MIQLQQVNHKQKIESMHILNVEPHQPIIQRKEQVIKLILQLFQANESIHIDLLSIISMHLQENTTTTTKKNDYEATFRINKSDLISRM